ncbi:MAG: penicillin-binding protein 2 [Chitinophagaceae bacterium]|nr:MAG: penicillin-binding protein 2 [Chitinophagaceae bacterium]
MIWIIFSAVVFIYLIKLFHLQIIDKQYKDRASTNVIRKSTIYPSRGLIYDRNGNLIVVNDAGYDLKVVPNQIRAFDTLRLVNLLNIEKEFIESSIQRARRYSFFKPSVFLSQLSAEEFAGLQEYLHHFPGFFAESRTVRKYPFKAAANILGYIGEVNESQIQASGRYYRSGDYIGVTGIEQSYEEHLRGQRGVAYYLVDVHNRVQGSFSEGSFDTLPVPGKNLISSLDIKLQQYGEKLMQNKRGSIVAIEPATGEILALVSSPSYDPNILSGRKRGANFRELVQDTLNPLFNRPIMAEYPPGSIYKSLMALVALEDGVITPQTSYNCSGAYFLGRLRVGCRHHPPASDLDYAVMYSCNSYFCDIFRRTIEQDKFANASEGIDNWQRYMNKMGLGVRLGIDIPNEKTGFIPGRAFYDRIYPDFRWRASTIISLGIGQGELSVTPLQMANMMAFIANRGYFYRPHLIKEVEGMAGQKRPEFLERHSAGINEKHFEPIVRGLYRTITEGTGRRAIIQGIEVCGKTGTAENPHGESHSLFVAFAPKENPEISIAVIVENAGSGGRTAAPIAGLMMEYYLNDSISDLKKPVEKEMLNLNLIEKYEQP